MQWTRLANTLVLSCQPSCREMMTPIDAEWWGTRCVMVNPLKKVLASFPEQIFGMQSKHPLHAGLDWRNGQIYLNKLYCQAYGLKFDGKECYSSVDQTIGEFFLGKTVYRALKTSVVQPPNYPHIPPVPYHPAVSLEVNLSDTIPLPDTSQVAREVTAELLADFGVDIAAHVVEKILRKKSSPVAVESSRQPSYSIGFDTGCFESNSLPVGEIIGHGGQNNGWSIQYFGNLQCNISHSRYRGSISL
ncbi:baculo_p74_N domain-containing protein [Trichonephila clavipes]|nr:baculo_p74_N domain-containing protein [Trichonephila clavipes]